MPEKNNIQICGPSGPGLLPFIILINCLIFMPCLSWAEYNYHEIIPPGWQEAEATGINDSGVVVGSGRNGEGNFRGFVYTGYLKPTGTYKQIMPFGWKEAFARGINNNGDIVGHGLRDGYKGFLYSQGDYTEISPPGWKESYAYDINDKGDIAGYGRKGRSIKGFLYSKGTYTELLPPGWREAYAHGINNSGVVAGSGRDRDNKARGYLYSQGNYRTILPPGWTEAAVFDINDTGGVAGHGCGSNYMGFIFSGEEYREISPPRFVFIEIHSINNTGSFAGRVLNKNSNMAGFVQNGSSFITLLPPGWEWSRAYAVNNNGAVAGTGVYGARTTGFVAMGVPDIIIDPEMVFFGGDIGNNVFPIKGTTIKNIGSSELLIGRIEGPKPPFSMVLDNCSGQSLAPFAACSINFSYAVSGEVSRIASVNIPSNDPEKNIVTLILGVYPDNDGDGYTLDVDCNDNEAAVHLGAVEVPGNNRDDDCDPATTDQ